MSRSTDQRVLKLTFLYIVYPLLDHLIVARYKYVFCDWCVYSFRGVVTGLPVTECVDEGLNGA